MSESTWNIPLPEGAEEPVEVYLNSVQLPPDDYEVEGRWVRIHRQVRPKQQLGFGRRLMLGFGIGVYGDLKADQVDVSYRLDGRIAFSNDVTVIAPTHPPKAD